MISCLKYLFLPFVLWYLSAVAQSAIYADDCPVTVGSITNCLQFGSSHGCCQYTQMTSCTTSSSCDLFSGVWTNKKKPSATLPPVESTTTVATTSTSTNAPATSLKQAMETLYCPTGWSTCSFASGCLEGGSFLKEWTECNIGDYDSRSGYLPGNLVGTIPEELGLLTNVTVLLLDQTKPNSKITGTLPESLSNLNVQVFTISGFDIEGTIPAAYGNLKGPYHAVREVPTVYSMDLSNNKLSGTIPAELFASAIRNFRLQDNLLNGTIPDSIGMPAYDVSRTILQLQNNKLTGTIPATIGNLVDMDIMDLSNNNLSGPIPSSFSNFTKSIRFLKLFGNALSGKVPKEVCSHDVAKNFNACEITKDNSNVDLYCLKSECGQSWCDLQCVDIEPTTTSILTTAITTSTTTQPTTTHTTIKTTTTFTTNPTTTTGTPTTLPTKQSTTSLPTTTTHISTTSVDNPCVSINMFRQIFPDCEIVTDTFGCFVCKDTTTSGTSTSSEEKCPENPDLLMPDCVPALDNHGCAICQEESSAKNSGITMAILVLLLTIMSL